MPFPAYQTLIPHAPQAGVGIVMLNRPDAANALNTQMALELKDFFEKGLAAEGPPKVVILSGQGAHFCAGADLKERQGMSEEQWKAQHQTFEQALGAILACEAPVIAAVEGAVMGGGLELALACDFIYAAENTRFAFPETSLGILPGLGGTQHLPRAVGMARAKELIFTGRIFTAAEALSWGAINKICATDMLLRDAAACAATIAGNAPLSVMSAKRTINQGITLPIAEALRLELTYYNLLLATRDRLEGMHAWREKRKPVFTGG